MERNIRLFSYFNFFTDFIPYAPIAIIYFSNVSGSYALGMSVFSVVMLTSAFFEIPTGVFSDMIGRKNTVIAGSISRIISAVFYAIGGSYGILLFGAVLEGLSRSFYSGNNDAMLHDSLTELKKEDDFHVHYGKTSAMFQLGLAISAVLGGILAQWSFALVMWVSVVPQMLTFFVSLFLSEPNIYTKEAGNIFAHLQDALKQFRTNTILRYTSVVSVIKYTLGEGGYLFRSAFFISLWPVWALGIASFMTNLGAAISYYFSGKLINKLGAKKVLNGEILFNRTVALIGLGFPSVFSPAIMSSSALTYGAGETSLNMILQRHFSTKQRATMSSLKSLAGSITFAIFAVLLGKLGDLYGPRISLIVTQLLLFTPLIFYRLIFKKERNI
ncbi:MFS transporter [Candidatus Gottesmanbacteria bacterium]|nr:MFS transporter [Candidatus Gottesmanbacteria bacterium]